MNKPEILSFTYQEIYLSRILITSRKHLAEYIKYLAKKEKIPARKIIFHHDLDDTNYNFSFDNNFKIKNSYDWLKEVLK